MRTTVSLPHHLYVEARRLAAERNTSLTALLAEGLRAVLAEARRAPPESEDDEPPLMDGGKLRKWIDLTDTSGLWEL